MHISLQLSISMLNLRSNHSLWVQQKDMDLWTPNQQANCEDAFIQNFIDDMAF